MVGASFDWAEQQRRHAALLHSNPLTKALNYALERRVGLMFYLADPDVPIDANHLERAQGPLPMGRKAWLFCCSEVGAEAVATFRSLIVSCRLHDIDPYTDWFTSCGASTGIRRVRSNSSSPGCGSSASPSLRCVRICTTWALSNYIA